MKAPPLGSLSPEERAEFTTKPNGTNLSVYPDACSDVPPPLRQQGRGGWGRLSFRVQPNVAMASDNKRPYGNVGLLPLAALAPHPSPPLLSQGRG